MKWLWIPVIAIGVTAAFFDIRILFALAFVVAVALGAMWLTEKLTKR